MTDQSGAIIDPDKGAYIFVCGSQGSGKSVLARRLFDHYPYDKVCLDITGDVSQDFKREGLPFHRLGDPLPLALPIDPDGKQITTMYVPDMGAPDFRDNLDRVVGMAYKRSRVCLWIDEAEEVTTSNKTEPNMRRVLRHGRHRELATILCNPRPIGVAPLALQQADHLFAFSCPNAEDRKRISEQIDPLPPEGVHPHDFKVREFVDDSFSELGKYEYLWYNKATRELLHMPALAL